MRIVVVVTLLLSACIGWSGKIRADLAEPNTWRDCATRLLTLAGKPADTIPGLIELYGKATPLSESDEFMQYLIALMYVESRFSRTALSTQGAWGLTQLTDLAVLDAAEHCSLPKRKARQLQDSVSQVKYGACYLAKGLTVTSGDWIRTLIVYNGGYLQLSKYEMGLPMVQETSNYTLQVIRARQLCTGTYVK